MAKYRKPPSTFPNLPYQQVKRLTGPIARFMRVEAAAGVVLLICTITALVLANSPWADAFLGIWKTHVKFEIDGLFTFDHSLKHVINDGLMAIFFFVIGLEVKREIVTGELREFRSAALPIAAAIGGMVVPAGLYIALQINQPGMRGWGIPMATDIAFVVGCMALLGTRIPKGLRIMLLSLAIVDDIGAVLVIAVGYTSPADLNLVALAVGIAGLALCFLLARIGVRSLVVYTFVGFFVWLEFHESGVHATIAGVLIGLLTPARRWVTSGQLAEIVERASEVFTGELPDDQKIGTALRVKQAAYESISPLERVETTMHPWVGFFIMPIFALANAGVKIEPENLLSSIAIAVMVGLVIGKPVGVLLTSWIAVKTGLAQLPARVTWPAVLGGGLLAGIGFTMALFIAGLAFAGDSPEHVEMLEKAKIGILVGSTISAILGMGLLMYSLPKQAEDR